MAIHWQIPFMSLRSGTVYTVNIYDASYSGSPVQLKGGAQHCVTQEDDDEDFFANIRTQSGYIRIVDDGKDANGNTFNWKTFVPSTDTDRPVTITHMVSGSAVLDWQGFMQAQNFGATLFGDPQEKEYPIQCALTVLEGSDIDHTHVAIENFAFVLRECLNEIDRVSGGVVSNHEVTTAGAVHINTVYVQGGVDGRRWLLKRIDWQNFVSQVGDDFEARYNLYEVLQDICRFWGWTARTYQDKLYLTRADDTDIPTFAVLSRAQLSALAGGTDASDIASFYTVALTGEEFVSMNNDDYRQRGHNKATVNADCNDAENDNMIEMDEKVMELMEQQGWGSEVYQEGDYQIRYTNDLLTFSRPLVTGTCRDTFAAFALGQITSVGEQPSDAMKMIRIKKTYNAGYAAVQPYAQFTTVYHHIYADGYIAMHGKTYRRTKVFEETAYEDHDFGVRHMYMRLGVGKTRNTATWYNGNTWGHLEEMFKVTIGNRGNDFYAVSQSGGLMRTAIPTPQAEGLLFVEFLGSDDLDDIDGEKSFELEDFTVEYYKNNVRDVGHRISEKVDLPGEMEYTSKNQNNVRDEWNADCIYASDNDMAWGYGLLINPDGTFMQKAVYGATSQHPEQNLADRVTAYWQQARRKVSVEMRSDDLNVSAISPEKKVTLDSTTFYPISISRDWRDDVTNLTMLELPT